VRLWIVALSVFVAGCYSKPPAVVLVYEAEPLADSGGDVVDIEPLLRCVRQRINPAGVLEIIVRQTQPNAFEILFADDDPREVERVERLLASPGTLEFRVLANSRDHADIIERALADTAAEVRGKNEDGEEVVQACWIPLQEGSREADIRRVEVILNIPGIAKRTVSKGSRDMTELLVIKDHYDVTGRYMQEASAGTDHFGKPCVNFRLTQEGGRRFTAFTGNNLPEPDGAFTRKLAIIINGRVFSAPALQSTIADRGEITGDFTYDEVKDLVAAINAGAMPAKLTLIEKRIGGEKTPSSP
jgi:SecD/SecF fusion protein